MVWVAQQHRAESWSMDSALSILNKASQTWDSHANWTTNHHVTMKSECHDHWQK